MKLRGLFQTDGPKPAWSLKGNSMLRELLTAVGAIPLVIACAPFAQAMPLPLSQEQLVLVSNTCTRLLGLKPGETYFAACRQTLGSTLQTQIQDKALAWAYQTCREQGLAQTSTALSTCVTDRQRSAPETGVEHLRTSSSASPRTLATKSFYEMSPSQRFAGERGACAQVGFEPQSSSFDQCMARFQGAFLTDPN